MNLRFALATSILSLAALGIVAGAFSLIVTSSGCSTSDGGGKCTLKWEDATLDDKAICAQTAFTSPGSGNIDNPFLPFAPSSSYVLEGIEDGEQIRVEITVAGTKLIAGVTVRVVNEKEYENGVLIEDTNDWYAQAADGSVCYFGEAVTNYLEDGSTNTEGSWSADFVTNFPGIIMPKEADIVVGAIYIQERAPGLAEDMSEIVALDEAISVPAGDYSNTFTGNDCNPLGREKEDKKIYARTVGLVYDNGVELISGP